MKTLILMRHAKSSWNHPGLSDHERPLNKRGRRSAQALGDWLRSAQYLPDEVISSDATRTRETYSGLDLDLAPQFTRALYHATATQILSVLKGASGDRVLMIGHNPGIADFAHQIVQERPQEDAYDLYPTGATLVARFAIPHWSMLDWAQGEVTDFVIPRQLVAAL